MSEKVELWLCNAEKTKSAGSSLAVSLYAAALDIFCIGELGAGKTTFIQGFAEGLGVPGKVLSPTFALEQYYRTLSSTLLHIDLYRLSLKEAEDLVSSTDDCPGIRCIEWADRLPKLRRPSIVVEMEELDEAPHGRRARITFSDVPLPTRREVLTWRKNVRLPSSVVSHCDAVGAFAEELARLFLQRGTIARPLALRRAGELHDLFRFIDFHPHGAHSDHVRSKQEEDTWSRWREHYRGLSHETACGVFLREQGYAELARIIEPHGLKLPPKARTTIEQKLLFYADKRVRFNQVVSLRERFEDFEKRYGKGDSHTLEWHEEALRLEKELFPHGVPFPR